jgi:LysR family glycine cleavage system transcriptional activator
MEYAPDLQVKFSTAMSSEPYTDADVLITLGGPESHAPGLERHLLFQSKLIPVANAAMAATLHSVDDLRNARLLHSTLRPTAWANWAQGAGVDLGQGEGMDFSNLALAYQAAVDGVGVAVGEVDLLADDLASGKLVCPFGPVVRSGAGYWLVYPTRLAGDPRITRFKDWITSVAQEAEAAEAWAKYIPANKDMSPERAQAAGR